MSMLARVADFQTAWYLGIVGGAMAVMIGVGAVYAGRGVRQVWREDAHGTAALIAAALSVGMLFLVSLFVGGIVGLALLVHGGGDT